LRGQRRGNQPDSVPICGVRYCPQPLRQIPYWLGVEDLGQCSVVDTDTASVHPSRANKVYDTQVLRSWHKRAMLART
jgi:hypothetical protein